MTTNIFQILTIQTFDDAKQGRPLERIFIYDKEQCARLNEQGAGIFWCINPQEYPDKRGIENTGCFNCLGLDCDVAKDKDNLTNESLTELKTELFNKLIALPVPPTGIIETKNGIQPYWMWTEPKELKSENRTRNNEEYKQLVKGFTKITGIKSEGDSICRVLRMPSYYHQKSDKFLIQKIHSGNKVDFKEFIKAYPPITEPTTLPQTNVIRDSALESIPVREVLERLSGLDIVDNECYTFKRNSNGTTQIIINSKPSKHYITTDNRIGGNSSGEIGTPTVINWLAWYFEQRGNNRTAAHAKAYEFLYTLYPHTRPVQQQPPQPLQSGTTNVKLPESDINKMAELLTSSTGNKGIQTGYTAFDSITGGLKPQFTYLFAARSKNCKSLLSLNMLVNIAKRKIPAVYFDLENGEIMGTKRLIQIYTGWESSRLESLDENDKPIVTQTLKAITQDLPLYTVYSLGDYQGDKYKQVLGMIRAYVERYKVRVAVIDNMNCFTTTTNDNNSYFSSIYSAIDSLANELNISIIVIHHITDKGLFENLTVDDFEANKQQPITVPHISKVLGTSAAISKMKVGATMALNPATNEIYFWLQTNRDGEQDKRFKLEFDAKTLRIQNPVGVHANHTQKQNISRVDHNANVNQNKQTQNTWVVGTPKVDVDAYGAW